jgi:hypothetical protein
MLSGIDDPGGSRMGEISMSGSTREREAAVIGLGAFHSVLPSLLYCNPRLGCCIVTAQGAGEAGRIFCMLKRKGPRRLGLAAGKIKSRIRIRSRSGIRSRIRSRIRIRSRGKGSGMVGETD